MYRCARISLLGTFLIAALCAGLSMAQSPQGPYTFVVRDPACPTPAPPVGAIPGVLPPATPFGPAPNGAVPNGAVPNFPPPAAYGQMVAPASFNAQPGDPLASPFASPFAAERPEFDVKDWARKVDQELGRLAREREKQATQQAPLDRPTVNVGGRIQLDSTMFEQTPRNKAAVGDAENGIEFRRARIFLNGSAFQVIDYELELDFANAQDAMTTLPWTEGPIQSTAFKNVYIGINELPWLGHVRIGHMKEPFGLERLTNSKYITFMERSLLTDTFAPDRSTGIMAFDWSAGQRTTWAIGAFCTSMPSDPPIRQNDEGGTALTMRYTMLPWYDEGSDGRGLLHLGFDYSYRYADRFPDRVPRYPARTPVRFRTRPEAHLAPFVVDTDEILDAEYWQLACAEAAFVYGPLSFQTEYCGAFIYRPVVSDLEYHAFYAQASYFLTGEHRPYDRTRGRFTRVQPFENFFRVRDANGCVQMGKGAWEVAYRYSYVYLNDSDVFGGFANDHTVGLNWYLNSHTRLMWNYVQSRATPNTDPASDMSIFEMRAQIDF